MVSAAGENIPVFVSPVKVIDGAETVPAGLVTAPAKVTFWLVSILIAVVAVPPAVVVCRAKAPSFDPVVLIPDVPLVTPLSLRMVEGI
jgi:hypothetical protein